MDAAIKDAGIALAQIINIANNGTDIVDCPGRFFGLVMDTMIGIQYDNAKRLIKKGLDSGVYSAIFQSKDRNLEAQKSVYRLINDELMTEYNAKQTIGLLLIGLDSSEENLQYVDNFIGATEHQDDINMEEEDPNEEISPSPNVATVNTEILPLLKRMFIFLEEKNWTSAAQYAERVLDKDPECSKAYLGKLMAELKVPKEILLCEASTPQIAIKENFKRACKYATAEELKILKDYEYRNAYAHGKDVMNRAKTEKNFKDASTWFALYPTYKDSKALYGECIKKAEIARKEALYQEALSLPLEKQANAFSAISGYRDADAKRQQAIDAVARKEKMAQLLLDKKREREQKERSKGASLTFLGFIIVVAAVVIDFLLVQAFKHTTAMFRWLWLPLISFGFSLIVGVTLGAFLDNIYVGEWIGGFWQIVSIIWGAIRGIIVVVAYFKASSGWAVLGAIFLCLFMFIFNSFSYFVSAGICSKNN